MSATAVIITVGGTADPIVKAVEEVQAETAGVTVFLLYGRPFPGQKPSPFDVAAEAQRACQARGILVRTHEVADPEDINVCLSEARRLFRALSDSERIIVNFTGGTKPLSAAVVHAALAAELSGALVLDYTGGAVRDEHGRVVREAMRVVRSERTATEERLQQAVQSARRSNYQEAQFLCQMLPGRGRAGFVKQAIEALFLWDEFDYEGAHGIVKRLQEPARALEDDPVISPLARLVIRLGEPSQRLKRLLPTLRRTQQDGETPKASAHDDLPLLVADILENSRRRLEQGRPTDGVLRAYRAIESAVQGQLLRRGVNPWHPQWDTLPENVRARFLELLNATREPSQLTLSTGLALLEALGQTLDADMRKWLMDVQQARNFSYLEHGYLRCDRQRAERVHEYAGAICEAILNMSLADEREKVRHRWE